MKPGKGLQNIAVGIGYLVGAFFAIILWPVTILGGICYIGFAVATNRHGWKSRLENSSLSTIPRTLPGMKPGHLVRNTAIGVGYFLGLLLAISMGASAILLGFIYIAFAVATDRHGWGTRLSNSSLAILPGFKGGGVPAAIGVFVYPVLGLVVLSVVFSLAGFGGTDSGADIETTDGEAAATEEYDDRHTVAISVSDSDGNVVSNAEVEFVHDDAIIFNTRETKQTNDDGIATFETDHDSDVRIKAEADGYEDDDLRVTIQEDTEVNLTIVEIEDEPDQEAANDADNERHNVTVSAVDTDGNPIANADVEFVHDDAIIFNTRENKQADSDGVATFETDHDSTVQISAEASGYEDAETTITITEPEEVTLVLADEPEETEATSDTADSTSELSSETTPEEAQENADPASVDSGAATQADGGQAVEQESAQAEISPEFFEAFLVGSGYDVEVEQRDGITWVDHTTYETETLALAEEIAYIAGAYSAVVDSGADTEILWVTVYHPSGEYVATWYVDAEWAQSFADDEMSEEEFVATVLETIET